MHHSGRNHSCPVCSRVKDADCRWSDEIILCHTGTDLRPGSTIAIDGRQWALIRHNGGFSGQAAVFRPHRADRSISTGNTSLDLDRKARRAVASFSVQRFLDRFQSCWNLPDFHSLPPDDLRQAFALIDTTYADGLALSRSLAPIWREQPDFAALNRWRIESCIKSLKHQHQDALDFRRIYLGEVAA